MMQSLEAVCDEGERAVKRLKSLRAATLPLASLRYDNQASCSDFDPRPLPKSSFDIFKELRRLQGDDTDYSSSDDSCGDEQDFLKKTTKYKSLVLESVVKREKLNTIILNLYPGNKGYSLSFRLQNRNSTIMCFKECSEELINTMARGYEEDTILRCIDNQEIPAFILEALDKFDFLFYSGCVIAEIRNYRLAYPENKCYIHHVLLRPTQKTLLADITTLTSDRSDLSSEDRDAIESQLVLAHTPDLCLDPDPGLESRLTKIETRGRLWNGHPFRKMSSRASQVVANRKRKLNHFANRHGLELLDFSKAKKSRTSQHPTASLPAKSNKAATLEKAQTVIPVPDLEGPALSPPPVPIVINKFKPMAWPDDTSDCSPHLMEEYTLETDITSKDKDKPRVYHIKLSIFQRPANMEFLGELYLDRDHKKDQKNGVSCRFSLGSRPNAHRYVRQFTEIFTESGRKTARISCGLVSSTRNDTQGVSSRPVTTTAPTPSSQPPKPQQQLPNPREQVDRLAQRLQAQSQQTSQPIANGIIQSIHQVQQPNVTQTSAQPQKSYAITSQELEIDALATKLEISSQEFQAAEKAKLQATAAAQQQKLLSNSNIISLLNSSPASSVNSDTSAAVANAINNPNVVPQQRLLARKMTFSNVTAAGARVLSHGNFIALNNHNRVNLHELNAQLSNAPSQTVTLAAAPVNNATRVNLSDLSAQLAASAQPQMVTLTSVNSSGGSYSYTAMPVKQQVGHHQRLVPFSPQSDGSDSSQSALGALLVGTPAADRPEIASPHQTNSLLLEKLAASSTSGGQNPFAQPSKTSQATAQYVVQSPKCNTVISPMSSPPPQSSNTLNVQSLNLTELQSIPGLHNVQFQLQNFSQPISLALNVASQLSSGTSSQGQLLMSLPSAQTQNASAQSSGTQQVQQVVMNTGGGTAGSSQLAHLVTSGSVKNITHHNLRTASGSQTLQLTQGSPQFQLISQLQRPSRQNIQSQSTITGRTIQRTPITIKMAPNSSQLTDIQFNIDN
ncbi:transcription factor SPT20 homolog isoform X2 [Anthonomus grandis grandis]|uniref:transcription factor SPT20 homolog isoform X2 n=1 Tax=Anthonomus grandis grandis TaxID=2921223 RepID=UPI002165CA51|nr:transcription factor SPT20 homolog isoform X2 [Anthonomus grandis grandis]